MSERKPVMLDGKLEQFMVRVPPHNLSFRCPCGCNVFHKPDDTQLELYKCNSCGNEYNAE